MAAQMSLPTPLFARNKVKQLSQSMDSAQSYADWLSFASEQDQLLGKDQWRRSHNPKFFDYDEISRRCSLLKSLLENGDTHELLFALNEGIHGNMGGMGKAVLYHQALAGTHELIDRYVRTITAALRQVASATEHDVPFEEKLDFFRRASHCYGRSALMMSGGAGLIYFHHGVVNSLLEQGLLPNILSGSSAGSMMCAQIGSRKDDDLKDYFLNKRYEVDQTIEFKNLRSHVKAGTGDRNLMAFVDEFVGDMTFQEAFEHTGRYINISISPAEKHQTSRLMNAITSPNVTIRSACRASCSVPGLFTPKALEAKGSQGQLKPYLRQRRWVDGSMAQDLPSKRLARLFGVNHYIVSMINPAADFSLSSASKNADNLRNALAAVAHTSSIEVLKFMERLAASDRTQSMATGFGVARTLMEQEYAGDINLMIKRSDYQWKNLLFNFDSDDDIQKLVKAGERTTWPKIGMIRNCTQIGRDLDNLLHDLEHDNLKSQHPANKMYMTGA